MPEKIIEKPESGLSEEEVQFYRNAAEITLAQGGKFRLSELNALSEEEQNELFRQKSRESWQFAAHEAGSDGERKYPDLDGSCALGLFKLAGFKNADKALFVPPGQYEEDRVNIDTGGKRGIVIKLTVAEAAARARVKSKSSEFKAKTAFIDHHAPNSKDDTSATQIAYKMLKRFGFFEDFRPNDIKNLDRLVHFTTLVDNKKYLDDPNYNDYFNSYFARSWKTVLGLQKFTNFNSLGRFFKDKVDPTEELSDSTLKKLGFIYKNRKGEEKNRVLEMKERVEKSKKELEKMGQEGLIVDSDKYGKIAVDIGRQVPEGIDAARAFGCGGYISWTPEQNKFFINTVEPLQEEFSQGKKIRGRMWLRPNEEKDKKMTLRLNEVLAKMTGGKLAAQGALKEFLEREAKGEFATEKGGAPDNLPIEGAEIVDARIIRGNELLAQFGVKTLAQQRQLLKWIENKLTGTGV